MPEYFANNPPVGPYDPFTYSPGSVPGMPGYFGGGGSPMGAYGGAPGPTNPRDPAVLQAGGYYQFNPVYGNFTFVPVSPSQFYSGQMGSSFSDTPGGGGMGGGLQPLFVRSADGRTIEARDPMTGAPIASGGRSFAYNGVVYQWNDQGNGWTPTASTSQPNGPTNTGTPGAAAAPAGGAPRGPVTNAATKPFDYASLLPAGLSFLNNFLAGRQASSNAKAAQDAANKNREAALGFASPGNFSDTYNGLIGTFQNAYKPALATIAESLGLGEQSNLQSFDTDLARSGISSGSGIGIAGRAAIRGARQASYGEALRDFYSKSAQAAQEQAGRIQSGEVSASIGAPVTYIPSGPSDLQSFLTGGTSGAAAYNYYKALREQRDQPTQ